MLKNTTQLKNRLERLNQTGAPYGHAGVDGTQEPASLIKIVAQEVIAIMPEQTDKEAASRSVRIKQP